MDKKSITEIRGQLKESGLEASVRNSAKGLTVSLKGIGPEKVGESTNNVYRIVSSKGQVGSIDSSYVLKTKTLSLSYELAEPKPAKEKSTGWGYGMLTPRR